MASRRTAPDRAGARPGARPYHRRKQGVSLSASSNDRDSPRELILHRKNQSREALLTYRPTLTRREPMLRKANPRTGSPGASEFAEGVEAEIRHRWIFQKRMSIFQFLPSI